MLERAMLKEGYAMHMPSPNTVAPAQGLYQPDEFKDNCGFGLIAHMQGDASHDLVKTAMHSLSCMTHRGGIAADGKLSLIHISEPTRPAA